MVTHSSTSRPVQCSCMAERTGCPVFTDLWSYVQGYKLSKFMYFTAQGRHITAEREVIDTVGGSKASRSQESLNIDQGFPLMRDRIKGHDHCSGPLVVFEMA
jgi:hypothetical protein